MSRVAVSADRRFHRAHVKPSRRRALWRAVAVGVMKYVVITAVVLFIASKAVWFARESPLLRISHVVTAGHNHVSSEEIGDLLAELRGENILRADLDRWRDQLLASPWIQDATLRRSLPSTIEVTVRERQPIAIGRRVPRRVRRARPSDCRWIQRGRLGRPRQCRSRRVGRETHRRDEAAAGHREPRLTGRRERSARRPRALER